MLTPEYLSNMSDDIVLLYEELLNSIIEDISRRIVKTGGVTETADWQAQMAQNSGALYDEIVKETAKTAMLSETEVRRIFSEAQVESITFDNRIYSEAGLTPLEHLSPAALKVFNAGINKTNGLIRNLTKTTALETQKTYINACTLAEMQVESGAFSYQQAIRTAVRSAVKDGGFIHYPTGHRDRVDVAVRRAVLTGVSQTTGDVSLMNAQQLDCDLMEITAHGGARPSHAVWQGKIVSLSGRDGYLSLSDIGYGTGPGFKGWNCRHDWYPFFEGISERAYSDQQLKEFSDKKVVYNDEEIGYYEATQMQREMERRIRATRRELNGYNAAIQNADGLTKAEIQKDFDKAAVKLKRQEAAYKDFSYKTGIGTQNDRLQTIGFGKSVSQKAVWANKNAFLLFAQNANNIEGNFTKTQIIKLSSAADSFLGKYCKEKSHWSGKTIVDSSVLPDGVLGCKEWNCDITLAENADIDTIIHEHLHARSISACGEERIVKTIYEKWQHLEEGTVEMYTREICKNIGYVSYSSAYDDEVKRLADFADSIEENHFSFARSLFDTPLTERYSFLNRKCDDFFKSNQSLAIEEASHIRSLIDYFKAVSI